MSILEIVSAILMLVGAVFVLTGSVGLLRLPDALTQIHAVGITDTLGVGLIILGLAIRAGPTLLALKLLLILAILVLTTPTTSHAIARAVSRYRSRPWKDEPGRAP
ncbi:MAG: monovalent cation/H(+) antiporter subunit G [Gammaproteobacteria bacterium]|nr:monovalent cation/H(+) antiporter subunit G [Gammaproteobacteria bacterium]